MTAPIAIPRCAPLHATGIAAVADSVYAPFFNPILAALPRHVQDALSVGAVAPDWLPGMAQAATLQQPGYQTVETGYTLTPDGAAHLAVLTHMPGVTPAMWDWWFAWHGSDSRRYRLWHPQAHIQVGWADGRSDLPYYVGRTSHVVEYVGATRVQAAIQFVPPGRLGLDEAQLARQGETAIAARIGMRVGGLAVDTGWLLHHIRPVTEGAEMRSRFWLGGRYVQPQAVGGRLGRWLGRAAVWLQPLQRNQITDLLVHDAQEMNHLAGILPALYNTFGPHAAGRALA